MLIDTVWWFETVEQKLTQNQERLHALRLAGLIQAAHCLVSEEYTQTARALMLSTKVDWTDALKRGVVGRALHQVIGVEQGRQSS